MEKSGLASKKRQFNAQVRSNIAVGPGFYRLTLKLQGEAAETFSEVLPGRFVQLQLCNVSLPPKQQIPQELADSAQRQIILRRPFSFCDVRVTGEKQVAADILYRALGPATLRMTTLSEGDVLNIIGPLGNGFSVPDGKKSALLIAGGMGAPPLLHLGNFLSQKYPQIKPVFLAGAKTSEDFPFALTDDGSVAEFSKLGVESHIATDDGSAGFKGFVTDCAENQLSKLAGLPAETIIYSCGPEPMLARVAALAAERNIDCQISMERMMACGMGICQSCAVETRLDEQSQTVYKLCCKDGPVFDSRSIVFSV